MILSAMRIRVAALSIVALAVTAYVSPPTAVADPVAATARGKR
jgi:hypothetical protein